MLSTVFSAPGSHLYWIGLRFVQENKEYIQKWLDGSTELNYLFPRFSSNYNHLNFCAAVFVNVDQSHSYPKGFTQLNTLWSNCQTTSEFICEIVGQFFITLIYSE